MARIKYFFYLKVSV